MCVFLPMLAILQKCLLTRKTFSSYWVFDLHWLPVKKAYIIAHIILHILSLNLVGQNWQLYILGWENMGNLERKCWGHPILQHWVACQLWERPVKPPQIGKGDNAPPKYAIQHVIIHFFQSNSILDNHLRQLQL